MDARKLVEEMVSTLLEDEVQEFRYRGATIEVYQQDTGGKWRWGWGALGVSTKATFDTPEAASEDAKKFVDRQGGARGLRSR